MLSPNQDNLIIEIQRLFTECLQRSLEIWLVGGWAIEAQILTAKRHHDDIDVAVAQAQMSSFTDMMISLGYCEIQDNGDHTLRVEFQKGTLKLHSAALRFGERFVCMSVPYNRRDAWLCADREWFSLNNYATLGDSNIRCAHPEALLLSKLSCVLHPNNKKALAYQQDINAIVRHLHLDKDQFQALNIRAKPQSNTECATHCPCDIP